jgi:hypothetical protein
VTLASFSNDVLNGCNALLAARDAVAAMTALRPLGAARSLLLCACVICALIVHVSAQNAAATAVPPAYAVQPLYGELLAAAGTMQSCRKRCMLHPMQELHH